MEFHRTSFPELRGNALLSQHGAEMLFAGAPEDAGASRSPPPGPASRRRLRCRMSAHIHTVAAQIAIQSPNIVAELKGSDPTRCATSMWSTPRMWIILESARQSNGDNVCHGALDNASGTSTLLEIARAYASLPQPPRRSVLFVFVTGEEMGLLGSDYFAHFPTVPLKSIVANVNIDGAPGVYFPMKDVVALGVGALDAGRRSSRRGEDHGIRRESRSDAGGSVLYSQRSVFVRAAGSPRRQT